MPLGWIRRQQKTMSKYKEFLNDLFNTYSSTWKKIMENIINKYPSLKNNFIISNDCEFIYNFCLLFGRPVFYLNILNIDMAITDSTFFLSPTINHYNNDNKNFYYLCDVDMEKIIYNIIKDIDEYHKQEQIEFIKICKKITPGCNNSISLVIYLSDLKKLLEGSKNG